MFRSLAALALLSTLSCSAPSAAPADPKAQTLLHVSFDATRELYDDVNAAFARKWSAEHDTTISLRQSHGGSGKQARAVLDGLEADIVTLALPFDVDVLATKGALLPTDWQARWPHQSAPFSSTIVFVVRAGNPKGIRDWDDLIKADTSIVAANPKTSGGARLVTLAAWDHAMTKAGADDDDGRAFLSALYRNVVVLDTGARAAATSFSERGLGDVLVSWESDARLLLARPEGNALAIVLPSSSVRADLPVAVVDANVDKHGTRAAAEAYVAFLFSPEGQEIAARHHYRPLAGGGDFPDFPRRTVDEIAGSWRQAQQRFFDDGGVFDQIFVAR